MAEKKILIRLEMSQIQNDMIKGFSPSFARGLLIKLKKLRKEKRVLKKEPSRPEEAYDLSVIGDAVIGHLLW